MSHREGYKVVLAIFLLLGYAVWWIAKLLFRCLRWLYSVANSPRTGRNDSRYNVIIIEVR